MTLFDMPTSPSSSVEEEVDIVVDSDDIEVVESDEDNEEEPAVPSPSSAIFIQHADMSTSPSINDVEEALGVVPSIDPSSEDDDNTEDMPTSSSNSDEEKEVEVIDLISEDDIEVEASAVLSPSAVIFKRHEGSVFCCSITPASENLVVTGGEDDMGYLWDIKTGEEILAIHGHNDSVTHAVFNYDGSLFVTADMRGKLQVHKVTTKALIWETETSDLFWAAWHPGANILFAGTEVGHVYMWRIPSGEVKFLSGSGAHVDTAVVMPDGKRLCVALTDGVMKVIDLRSMSVQHQQPVHNDSITGTVAHHDNILTFSGSTDGTAKLFNTKTGNVVSTFSSSTNGEEAVESVKLSPDPAFPVGVSATLKGTVQVWDLPTQTERNRINLDEIHGVSVIDWQFEGSSTLCAGALDGSIILIDTRTDAEEKIWKPHLDVITDMAICSDGKTIVTASEDGTSRVMNIQ